MNTDQHPHKTEPDHTNIAFDDHAGVGGDVVGGSKYGNTYILYSSPAPHAAQSQSAQQGLTALAELMADAQVREAVVVFHTEFAATCEQIEILGTYKDLHDLLHTLESQCYWGIVREARHFPDDETALEILSDHNLTLQQIIKNIQAIATKAPPAPTETGWISDLAKSHTELSEAIAQSDHRRLQRVIWLLNRVLAIQPSRINTSLNIAARALRLPALLAGLISIQNKLVDSALDPDKMALFQEGVTALTALENGLTLQIQTHDQWQEIDLELRRIEGNLDKDVIELEMSWPDLKRMLELLYLKSPAEERSEFCKDGECLEQAIAHQNPAQIRRYFRSYRRRASNCFYRVDVDLKRFCGELRRVGEPLASVLRMLR